MSLFNELKRRNVFRVATAYLVAFWLIIQVADVVLGIIGSPDWVMLTLLLLLGIGFVAAIIISWIYEITPEGIKKEHQITGEDSITHHTAKRLDYIIIVLLVVAIGIVVGRLFLGTAYLEADKFTAQTSVRDTAQEKSLRLKDELLVPIQSVAVLPFENRSNDPSDSHFVEGMHDDLLTKLAKIQQLKVISRTSVMEYKDTRKRIPIIARELGVHTILEGGVQRGGKRIRINVQLINGADESHLWAEAFDRELTASNMFDIQTEITLAIADALQATLSSTEWSQIKKPLTNNLQAWEAYQKSSALGFSTNLSNLKDSIAELKKAVAIDPLFAAAYANLGNREMALFWYDGQDIAQRERAWLAIEKARSLDTELPQLYFAEAAYYYWGFKDYPKALIAIEEALSRSPNDSEAVAFKGYIQRRAGQFEESIQTLHKAANLAPRLIVPNQENAETAVMMRRYQQAEALIEKVEKVAPMNKWISFVKGLISLYRNGNLEMAIDQFGRNKDEFAGSAFYYWWSLMAARRYDDAISFTRESNLLRSTGFAYNSPNLLRGVSLHFKGDTESAKEELHTSIEVLEPLLAQDQNNQNYLSALCLAYAAIGTVDKAMGYCQKTLSLNNDHYSNSAHILRVAESYSLLGDSEAVLQTLSRLLESPARPSANKLLLDPFFKPLKTNPHFVVLIKRIDSDELIKKKKGFEE